SAVASEKEKKKSPLLSRGFSHSVHSAFWPDGQLAFSEKEKPRFRGAFRTPVHPAFWPDGQLAGWPVGLLKLHIHSAHARARAMSMLGFFLRSLGDHHLGRQEQAGHGSCVLQREARDLRRIQNAELEH